VYQVFHGYVEPGERCVVLLEHVRYSGFSNILQMNMTHS